MVFSTKNTPKQRLWQSSRGEKRRGKKKKKRANDASRDMAISLRMW